MAATKAQINWAAVQFGSTAITRVTNCATGQGGSLIKFKGDTDIYPTIIANVDNEPHFSITSADVGVMWGFNPGAGGTLVATMKDAKGAGGGDVIFTMVNAVFENAEVSGQHAQFGTVTGTWQAFSSDGQTAPLTIARA